MARNMEKDLELLAKSTSLIEQIQKKLDSSNTKAEQFANKFVKLAAQKTDLIANEFEFSQKENKLTEKRLKDSIRTNKAALTFRNISAQALKPLEDQFTAISDSYDKYSQMIPVGGKVAGTFAAGVVALSIFNKLINDVRKDLGTSAFESAQIAAQLSAASAVGKVFGLNASDIKDSFDVISGTLGGVENATAASALNFARFSLKLGVSAQQSADLLKTLEAVSGASRSTLMSQLSSTKELIRQRGVAPGPVLQDVANSAEFFAKFSKEGSDNLFIAAAEARKLGLNLGAVESISNSLLNFEESIGSQLEAQVLLGRNINLDKARQLAFNGDNAGLLEEIKNIVGSEAEFNAMNVVQREALANAIGLNVSQLARVVAQQESVSDGFKTIGTVLGGIVGLAIGLGAAIRLAVPGIGAALAKRFSAQAIATTLGLGIAGAGVGRTIGSAFGDFVQRPGQAPTAFSPGDTIIGVKNPADLGADMGQTNALLRELIDGQERMRNEIKGGNLET